MFRLFGYAGSGKSTVLKFALESSAWSRTGRPRRRLRAGRRHPTFTGKAALGASRKGTPARTIHSLIYSVIEATEEEVEAAQKKIEQAEDGSAP